jgi:hypothetical protein
MCVSVCARLCFCGLVRMCVRRGVHMCTCVYVCVLVCGVSYGHTENGT